MPAYDSARRNSNRVNGVAYRGINVLVLWAPVPNADAAYVVAIVRAAVENPDPISSPTAVNLNYTVIVFLVTAITRASFGLVAAADLFGKVERIPMPARQEHLPPTN